MGYAARANETARAALRGEIVPRKLISRPYFTHPDFRAQWRAFFDRIGKAHKPLPGEDTPE